MKYFQATVQIFLIILTLIIPFYRGNGVKSFNSLAMPPMMGNESLSWKFVPQGINIYAIYSSEPAPMGIADYGIGPNGPYILTTNSWKGVVYLNSVNVNTSEVTFQLNVNLYYTYNDHSYDLFVQNVAVLNVTNKTLFFVDNIWNSTALYANVTGVIGNGRIYSCNSCTTTFYAYLAWNYPGSPEIISFPTTFQLKVDVTTNSQGEPVICFYYNDGYGWIKYDTVTVINAPGASNVHFMVNGYEYTGVGNYFDAELVMAGPPGGHTAYVYSANVGLQLFYWNGHNYQEIKNAYDFGSDTAEKLYNAYVYSAYFTYTGELLSVIISGSGTLGQLWNQNSVEVVQVNSPVYSGYAKIYNFSIPFSDSYMIQGFNFTGGEFIQTLVPTMQYSILVYSSPNGTLEDEGYAPPEYGYVVVNAESFSITPSQYNISLSRSESTTLTLNIIGEGPVY
ncbi:MAG: thermopsin, partial [Sulfolobus sp.]|nr:thermopsin [Sulfolobus sp.]